jgi:hypothetical protein
MRVFYFVSAHCLRRETPIIGISLAQNRKRIDQQAMLNNNTKLSKLFILQDYLGFYYLTKQTQGHQSVQQLRPQPKGHGKNYETLSTKRGTIRLFLVAINDGVNKGTVPSFKAKQCTATGINSLKTSNRP